MSGRQRAQDRLVGPYRKGLDRSTQLDPAVLDCQALDRSSLGLSEVLLAISCWDVHGLVALVQLDVAFALVLVWIGRPAFGFSRHDTTGKIEYGPLLRSGTHLQAPFGNQ